MGVEGKGLDEKEVIIRAKYNPTRMDLKPEQIVGFVYERQIRTERQQQQFREMVANIKVTGITSDISVRRVRGDPDTFQGIFGWMRFLAGKEAEIETYPAYVYPDDMSDADVWMLILSENLVGVDPSDIDIAEQIYRYKETSGFMNKTIAVMFGKSESWVSSLLKVRADNVLSSAVEKGEISKSQAKELGRISNAGMKTDLIEAVKGTNVEETRKIVEEALSKEERVQQIEKLKRIIEEKKEKLKEAKERETHKIKVKNMIIFATKELQMIEETIPEEIIELTETIRAIEVDYYGAEADIQRYTAQINELRDDLKNLDKAKLEKERISLEKEVGALSEKIEVVKEQLRELKDEKAHAEARQKEVLQDLIKTDEITQEIDHLQKSSKRAEEKMTRVYHEMENDIRYFDKVKAMLDEEKAKIAEKKRNKEKELATLNAELRTFGGMPVKKREEELVELEAELASLLSAS